MNGDTCVDNGDFARSIARLIEAHPAIYYRIQLEDSHIPFHVVERDMFNDVFCDVFTSYNSALFDSVRCLIRYEKSLKAWLVITEKVADKEIRDTLVMDYVQPVFEAACDLPNVFKDQLVRGCVKLASAAKDNYSYLREKRRSGWFGEMEKVCANSSSGLELCNIVNDDLFKNADAEHFRDIHGSGIHDLSESLVGGSSQTISFSNGLVAQAYTDAFDLGEELVILDRHRRRIQNAYLRFGEYGDALYRDLLGD